MNMLTRTECTAMRGLAIMAIVLHNYCHFIGRIVKENEYQFLSHNNDLLWDRLMHPDELLPAHLLSYFGHYGVPVFLFLSGYGLVAKYEHQLSQPVGVLRFARYNYLKLLRMLVVGLTLFIMVDAVTPGRFSFHWYNIVAQLLMYINVLPNPEGIIWPGIYWFFGLMMQFYLVYRLLLYRRGTAPVLVLVALCWLLQVVCTPDGETLNRLRYNCIGGMLPFGLGILACRWQHRFAGLQVSRWLWALGALLSAVLVTAMSFNFHTWLWVPLVVVAGSIALVKALPPQALHGLAMVGSLSAAMFVAHPIARKLFITVAWKGDIYDGLALYLLATVGLAWAVRQVISRLPAPHLDEPSASSTSQSS